MLQVLFMLLLDALLPCLPRLVAAEPDMKLVMVQVLHRDEARTAEPSYNKTQICGDTLCGYLAWSGVKMLGKTGAFLRNPYNRDGSSSLSPCSRQRTTTWMSHTAGRPMCFGRCRAPSHSCAASSRS
ncbi:hypothetical protein GH5_05458 [Leishmania sp. Ghana 2012 LV757]|uniref:hypothetical protein n=1 Tax=Leishmania sp. Ghana 2012 LV757 TaxID=2803181 RepID=UPI001B3EE79C|nr:hypothetical protein GH5_05458 [Leishmania sp. Ghana 2012 LV757]